MTGSFRALPPRRCRHPFTRSFGSPPPEAKLIQAKKEAEAQKIAADAENERNPRRLQGQREQARILAEGERERAQIELDARLAVAKAAAEPPTLLKLREFQTLAEVAKSGGKFVVGLQADGFAQD